MEYLSGRIGRVENKIITEKLSILVQPPKNYYWNKFIDIHGVTPEQTAELPTFDLIWDQIEPFITNQHVLTHNGFRFDFQCSKETMVYYGISNPVFTGHCTYRIFGVNLAFLCKNYGIQLNHHDALSDAMACTELFNLYLRRNKK